MAGPNTVLSRSTLITVLTLAGCDEEPTESTDTGSSSMETSDGTTTTSSTGAGSTASTAEVSTSTSSSSGAAESTGDSTSGSSSSGSSGDSTASTGESGGTDDTGGNLEPVLYQFGTSGAENLFALAVDSVGDAIVGGDTTGDFVGMPGMAPAYIHKVGYDGTPLWFDQFLDSATVRGLAVDSEDNIIAVGIAPGQGGFIRKLAPDGDVLWFQTLGAAPQAMNASTAVAIDSEDNIVVVGSLGPDAAIQKYPPQGADPMSAPAPTYATLIGVDNGGTDQFTAVAIDGNDDIFVAGQTSGALQGTNAGLVDAFAAAFDPVLDEDPSRRVQFGTANADTANGITVDAAGEVYVVGDTISILEFMGTELQERDGFVSKFGVDGELWSASIESSADAGLEIVNDRATAVTLDDGELVVVGVSGGLTGDISLVGAEVFERRYMPGDGAVVETLEWGTLIEDGAEAVSVGPWGPVVAGYTFGDLTMPDMQIGDRQGFVRLP